MNRHGMVDFFHHSRHAVVVKLGPLESSSGMVVQSRNATTSDSVEYSHKLNWRRYVMAGLGPERFHLGDDR